MKKGTHVRRVTAGPESAMFGRELRAHRRGANAYQSEVAEYMRVHPGYECWSRVTVSDVERGKRCVNLDEAQLLKKLFHRWAVAEVVRGRADDEDRPMTGEECIKYWAILYTDEVKP